MEDPVRILCVDDEKNVLRALERMFLDEDYEIYLANSADEGLALLGRIAPVQVIISDYRMPQMDGVMFLKEVYQQYPDTVRIVLSGYADTAAVVAAINEGQIYKFVPKPWNDNDLKISIENALESYALRKKNRLLLAELKESNRKLENTNANLEKIVAKRTSRLRFKNKVLARAQNILDALPVAVLGLDSEGNVVQVNCEFVELTGVNAKNILGEHRKECLPDIWNGFIDTVIEKQRFSGTLVIGEVNCKAKGFFMKNDDQEGVILVIDREDPV